MRGWSGYVWEPRYRVTGCERRMSRHFNRSGIGLAHLRHEIWFVGGVWWGFFHHQKKVVICTSVPW